MRNPQYTLTPAHVHAHVGARLQKYLHLADNGPRCQDERNNQRAKHDSVKTQFVPAATYAGVRTRTG